MNLLSILYTEFCFFHWQHFCFTTRGRCLGRHLGFSIAASGDWTPLRPVYTSSPVSNGCLSRELTHLQPFLYPPFKHGLHQRACDGIDTQETSNK